MNFLEIVKKGAISIRPRAMFPRMAHTAPGVNQVSASSSCDNPPPVCGLGSGHIGQGQGTYYTKDTASRGHIVQGTQSFGDTSVADILSIIKS